MEKFTAASTSTENLTTQMSVVLFRLTKQIFALPIEPVYQFIEMVAITPLPKADPLLEGVINVRGEIVPVFDMHKLLDFPFSPKELHTPILLVTIQQKLTGLIIDEVLEILSLDSDKITIPEHFVPSDLAKTSLMKGITRMNQGLVILLDLDHLFEPGQAQALSSVTMKIEAIEIPANLSDQPSEQLSQTDDLTNSTQGETIKQSISAQKPSHRTTSTSKSSRKG